MSAATVFWPAAALLGYVIAGYPLLLAVRRRFRSRPVRKGRCEPSVSVIVAVYNGERYLRQKLLSLLALDYPREKLDIVVASDGSTDRTNDIAASFFSQGVGLFVLPRRGKCAALNHAIGRAKGEILLLTDVRQTIEPGSLRALVRNLADPSVGAVSGHLKIRGGSNPDEAGTGLYWRFETWVRDSLSAVDSMLGSTGPLYAMRRELAVPLPEDILLDDVYLPLAAFRKGYRLVVEPQAIAWDYPTSRDVEFRRKVRTLAGNYQLWARCPWLLTPVNRMWFDFWSYKVGRLMVPALLAVLFAAAFFLPRDQRTVALAAQGAFYGLALFDPWLPRRSLLKRASSLARTFTAMMWAAVRGLTVLFVPARRLWKVTGAS